MATRYHLFDLTTGSKVKDFARKDASIKAAEKDGMIAFQIQTDNGSVVHTVDNRPAEQAPEPKPAKKTKAKGKKDAPAKEAKPRHTGKAGRPGKPIPEPETGKGETPLVYDLGNNRFTAVMLQGAADMASKMGVETKVMKRQRAVVFSGSDAATRRKVAEGVRKMWEAVYAEFRVWKSENKDSRRKQRSAPEGVKAVRAAEAEFLADAQATYMDVL